jgi:hypothetical protein
MAQPSQLGGAQAAVLLLPVIEWLADPQLATDLRYRRAGLRLLQGKDDLPLR